MKDQQEIQEVNSKFSLDRASLVRTGSVPEFQDQMERKKGQNVDKGMETRQEKKGEQKIIERRKKERERESVEKHREERENEERVENRKVRKEKRRADDVGLSQYLLSFFLTLGKEVSTFLHFMANGISSGRRWNSNVRISYPP